MASADQDQWAEICAAVRAQLAGQVERMPAMSPEEIQQLVGTIDTAMWTEVKARTFDADVEERLELARRAASYGG